MKDEVLGTGQASGVRLRSSLAPIGNVEVLPAHGVSIELYPEEWIESLS